MNQKIGLTCKGKKFQIDLRVCNFFQKFSGLMFARRESARALLFNFKDSSKITIHSLFVFFPFVAIWLDENNKILEVKKIRPFQFSVSCEIKFRKLIEIPCNKKYSEIVQSLVGD